MALKILDANGVNLVEQPPSAKSALADPQLGAQVVIQGTIVEDGALPKDYVSGTLHWNDGSLPIVYSGVHSGSLVVNDFRNLLPGTYVVRLEAHNYRTPVWDTVSVNFPLTIKPASPASTKTPLLYGPILPKDTGFPNADQWNWNTGTDIEVLASSVKMLLLTAKGERVMQPDYGTNVRALLFEFKSSGVESMLQNDIAEALSRWEPRVAIQSLSVNWVSDRSVKVNANFVSRLNQTSFNIPMSFSQ